MLFNGRKDHKCFKLWLWDETASKKERHDSAKEKEKHENHRRSIGLSYSGWASAACWTNKIRAFFSLYMSVFNLASTAPLNTFGNHNMRTQEPKSYVRPCSRNILLSIVKSMANEPSRCLDFGQTTARLHAAGEANLQKVSLVDDRPQIPCPTFL